MTRSVDDIVGPAHDPEISVVVKKSCISGKVIIEILREICLDIIPVIVPEGGEAARRKREAYYHTTRPPGIHFSPVIIEDPHIKTRHRFGAGSWFYREEISPGQVSPIVQPVSVCHQ